MNTPDEEIVLESWERRVFHAVYGLRSKNSTGDTTGPRPIRLQDITSSTYILNVQGVTASYTEIYQDTLEV